MKAFEAMLFLLACAACTCPAPINRKLSVDPPGVKQFDLVSNDKDANGFLSDPHLGWHWKKEHCGGRDTRNPAKCSWMFLENDQAPNGRTLCNTLPMDPDFSDYWLTNWVITCADSPLDYSGHVNWGRHYG